MIGAEFRDRYLVKRFASSGVVIDLVTGNYFRLNAPATAICEALAAAHHREEALERVARDLAIERAQAEESIAALERELAQAPVRGVPQGSYLFVPSDDGYSLWHEGREVIQVDGDDLTIRIPSGQRTYSDRSLGLYVRALAPKLLFLRGIDVLHAAAVLVDGKLLAFAGESGAGKTTTARAFVSVGAPLVSEDLLVFAPDRARGLEVVRTGETRAHAWVDDAVRILAADPTARASSADLAHAVGGETMPIEAVLFLDVKRRSGAELCTRRLSEADGMTTIMYNAILASPTPGAWRRFGETAVALGASTRLLEGTAPGEVGLLEPAARAYMSNWTS
jgi:hypothetical protein